MTWSHLCAEHQAQGAEPWEAQSPPALGARGGLGFWAPRGSPPPAGWAFPMLIIPWEKRNLSLGSSAGKPLTDLSP